jgi:error-prone DNA polymerase
VQDAKRHGVRVLPIDVTVSNWDSTIEGPNTRDPLRLGMSLVRGMKEKAAARIEMARAVRPFRDVSDLARRAHLDQRDLEMLAAANALRSLAGERRAALWQAVAAVPDRDLLRGATDDDETPPLAPMTEGQEIIGDYRSTGLTLGRHPLALLRPRLSNMRLVASDVLLRYRNGQLAHACGIVTVRQRPGTAKGVMFMTLEDEAGTVNIIVWQSVLEKFRREALGSSLLAVYGVWQREGEVRHLVANRLVDITPLLGELPTVSRDFC